MQFQLIIISGYRFIEPASNKQPCTYELDFNFPTILMRKKKSIGKKKKIGEVEINTRADFRLIEGQATVCPLRCTVFYEKQKEDFFESKTGSFPSASDHFIYSMTDAVRY